MEELLAERAYTDAAWARLQELRDAAVRLAAESFVRDEDHVVDSLFERDVVASRAAERLATLDVPKGRIAVGRLDRDDGDAWYIGRLAIADAAGDPLIIDWRAPAAEPFYRAVSGDPMGVVRRRHFRWRADDLVGLDDEVFDADGAEERGLGLVGEGALLAALTAPRTGRMTDVVATIQAEQDRVIRRPKAGVLVVQGAPGTGKTAVALHRAAYLLYAEHNAFRNHAILFVGPSQTFLRYVEEVVPSLGEDRVVLVTPSDLGPEVTLGREEGAEVTALKGDGRMATLVDGAVRDRQRPPAGEQSLTAGRFVLRLPPDALKRVVGRGRRAAGTHNARRRLVERGVLDALQQEFAAARAREVRFGIVGSASDQGSVLEVVDRRAVAALMDRVWPLLTPERLLSNLFRSKARLARAGRDVLSDGELALLQRDGGDERWSDADIPLLDEAAALLGPVPERRRRARKPEADPMVERVLGDLMPDCPGCGAELDLRPGADPGSDRLYCAICDRAYRSGDLVGDAQAQLLRTVHDSMVLRFADGPSAAARAGDVVYEHVVVDEAQDLSPMQWRALARRCPSLSLTVAGDQGQAIRAGSPGSWEAAVAALGAPTFELAELTVNYRTPKEVMTAAEAVLVDACVPFSTTRSVRSTHAPAVSLVDHAITPEVVQAIVDGFDTDGTVAVIAPRARCDELSGLQVEVIDVMEAKGLEFDAVVVVDPDAIAAEGEGGARRVYVAMTRTTNHLHVLREDRSVSAR